MNWHRHRGQRRLVPAIVLATSTTLLLLSSGFASDKNRSQIPAVRWDEEHPGCTFTRGQDGKYRYGLWAEDVGITIAVDSQELEKVHRRHEPFFAVMVTVRYRGQAALDFSIDHISLEFVRHYHVQQIALDPDDFSDRVQSDADTLNNQTALQVEKHPQEKEEKQAMVRAFLKDAAELEEFVGNNSLRPTKLSPGHEEVAGWVLFSTNSKWIGKWKKQENLILRVPVEGKVFEFPFRLPPKPGETILRTRE
jgi:hypothetical protein